MHVALIALSLLAVEPEAVHLRPGSHQLLKIPGLTRVAINCPEVADVTVPQAGELLVLGRKAGRCGMTLWTGTKTTTRQLVVDDGAGDDIARLVHDLVDPSLKVQTFEDRIVIDGTVDSVTDYQRLERLVADDPRVKLLVRLDPTALRVLAETITQALHRNGMLEARATAVGGRILLEGSVTDSAEREKAQTIADSYYGGFLGQR